MKHFTLLAIGFLFGMTAAQAADSVVALKDPALAAVATKYVPDRQQNAPLTAQRAATILLIRSGDMVVHDLSGIENFKGLRFLYIEHSQISDLTPLAGLTNLESISIQGGSIKDLAPLANLKKLTFLSITGNQISDLKPISGLTELQDLELANNQISDLRPLTSLTKLERIRMKANQVSDLTPLASLKNVVLLDLSQNRIRDLSPLKGVSTWRYLYLDGDQVADLEPLVEGISKDEAKPQIAPFRTLSLHGDPLTTAARSKEVSQLRKAIGDLDLDKATARN